MKPKPPIIFDHTQLFAQADTIFQIGSHIEQDVLCYLYFFDKKMRFDLAPCPLPPQSILFISKADKPNDLCQGIKLVAEDEHYLIFKPE